MSKINQDLIGRLQKTLGIGQAAVYIRIQKAGRQHRVGRRDLAALLLAWEHGVSIQKYANAEQIDRLEGLTGANSGPSHAAAPAQAPSATPRKTKPGKAKKTKNNSVFVVHGRDDELRKSMFAFLRALGLNPMEWGHAVANAKGANPYIGDIIEAAMAKVQAVVVLFSPDELAYLKEEFCVRDEKRTEGKPQGQPRPNVLFEAGLALGAHPEKTLLVQVGKVRGFSDIAGKHLVKLTNEVPKRNDVANRLAKLHCDVSRHGNDWMTVGDFAR